MLSFANQHQMAHPFSHFQLHHQFPSWLIVVRPLLLIVIVSTELFLHQMNGSHLPLHLHMTLPYLPHTHLNQHVGSTCSARNAVWVLTPRWAMQRLRLHE